MSWNNRVEINKYENTDGSTEYTAYIVEVHYTDGKVGGTGEISPMGSASTEKDAVLELKAELERMLESVQFVIDGKTTIYDYENKETHNPGAKSIVSEELKARYNVIDPDDAYRDEQDEENNSSDIVKNKNVILSIEEVIKEAHKFLDTNPEYKYVGGACNSTEKYPENSFYSEKIEVDIFDRVAQFKLRDNDLMKEYQLVLKPWNCTVSMDIWNDDPKSSSALDSSVSYNLDSEIGKVSKELMDRMYDYYNLTPCDKDEN